MCEGADLPELVSYHIRCVILACYFMLQVLYEYVPGHGESHLLSWIQSSMLSMLGAILSPRSQRLSIEAKAGALRCGHLLVQKCHMALALAGSTNCHTVEGGWAA